MAVYQGSLSSSFLTSYRYDTTSRMLILGMNGRQYAYTNVPQSVFEGLLNAGSKGQYFNARIKGIYG